MSGSAAERVAGLLGELAETDAPLGALTTYRVGGTARLLVRAQTREDLRRIAAAIQ